VRRVICIVILCRCILNLNSTIYFQDIVIFGNFATILILSNFCSRFNKVNFLYSFREYNIVSISFISLHGSVGKHFDKNSSLYAFFKGREFKSQLRTTFFVFFCHFDRTVQDKF
jgi:hypothetical protein